MNSRITPLLLCIFFAATACSQANEDTQPNPSGSSQTTAPNPSQTSTTTTSNTTSSPTDEPSDSVVIINEVAAAGDPNDWVELYNPSNSAVDLSGFFITDDLENNPTQTPLTQGTSIEANGYLLIPISDDTAGFKLGKDEEFALLDPEGRLVDLVDWSDGDSPEGGSFGRWPDQEGPFQTLLSPTPNSPNVDETVEEGFLVINEVAAAGDPDDWVELYNGTFEDVDLSGFFITDNAAEEPEKATLPEGMVIRSGAYLVLEIHDESYGFKLGKDEEFTLLDPDGNVVDHVDWNDGDSPEGGSFGRSPNGEGSFVVQEVHSQGEANGSLGN